MKIQDEHFHQILTLEDLSIHSEFELNLGVQKLFQRIFLKDYIECTHSNFKLNFLYFFFYFYEFTIIK